MALEDLEDLIESLSGKFTALESPLSSVSGLIVSVSGAAGGAVSSLGALAARTAGVGDNFDSASTRFRKANGQFVVAGEGAKTVAAQLAQKVPAALSQVGAAASAMGGVVTKALSGDVRAALSQVGGWAEAGIGKLQEKLASLGPYGQAVAAALGVLTAAVSATVGTMLDLMGTAIKVVESKAGILSVWSALAGGEAAGKAVAGAMGKLGDSLPFAGSQVRQWGESLLAAGTSADKLTDRVKAVASAEALMRDMGGGGAAAESLFKKLGEGAEAAATKIKDIQKGGRRSVEELAHMGISTRELAAAMGMTEAKFKTATISADQMADAATKVLTQKGAGPLGEMMGTWPVILEKARGGFMSLFTDLGPAVKPFMGAVKSLFGEFSKGGVAINLLKPIATAVFSTLFQWAKIAVDAIHKGFLYVVIGALMAYIALRPVIDAIKRFGESANFLTGLKFILTGIALVLAVMAIPFIIAGAAALLFVAAVGAVVAALVWVVGAISSFATDAQAALEGWVSGAADAASNFVAGLVQGIAAGAGAVADAVKGLATGALSAFTGALGIKSPSTVMLEHGEENIAGATATGIDRGSGKVKASMRGLTGEPQGTGKGRKGGGGGDGAGVVFNDCQFFGTTEGQVRAVWRKVLEELAGEAGAAPAGAEP